jgi:hypothetical protein
MVDTSGHNRKQLTGSAALPQSPGKTLDLLRRHLWNRPILAVIDIGRFGLPRTMPAVPPALADELDQLEHFCG